MGVDDIFAVAIDPYGHIIKIGEDMEKFIHDSPRRDLTIISLCSMSEYFEFCMDNHPSVIV